jgi:POT family proton-dependent oligopeptide transporter
MAKYTPLTAPNPDQKGWPGGIKYIIGNEGCERFSYYGMKALLAVYIAGLYMAYRGATETAAEDAATEAIHLFSAAVYTLPLIGAILSDRLLGKYRTIITLSIVYCLGHLALAIFENPAYQKELFGTVFIDPVTGLYIGLGLIAVGSGGIKPCVSAHVGDQFGSANWHLLQKVFNAFYFIINLGSAIATIVIPAIQGDLVRYDADWNVLASGQGEAIHYAYSGSVGWAFGIPGILMGLATIFFWMGRRKFIHVPGVPGGKLGKLDFLSGTFLTIGLMAPLFMFLAGMDTMFGLSIYVITPIVSLVSLGLFVFFFSARQKLEADDGFLAVMFFALKTWMNRSKAPSVTETSETADAPAESGAESSDSPTESHWFFGQAVKKFGAEIVEGPIAVLKVISVLLMVSVFWGLFHQHGTTWVHQAKVMDRSFDLSWTTWLIIGVILGASVGLAIGLSVTKEKSKRWQSLGIGALVGVGLGFLLYKVFPDTINERQVSAANPFLVMILIPYTIYGLYPFLDKIGLRPHPLRRMTIGMLMAAFSFIPIAMLQSQIEGGATPHVAWQFLPYIIVTLAEVMVSITGLEFAYSQAPKRMKSCIMGFWLVNVAIGDFLVIGLVKTEMSRVTFFWVFAGLMAVAGILFGLRARGYKYKDYPQ